MTSLFNSPETFRADMVDGLVSAYGRYLVPVPNASAVMRRDAPTPGKVAVVIGGGSGHYPTFAGFVGAGLADCAVIGDIFTSPSTENVYRSIRAVDAGCGVLLSYGRYSGDVMNFGLAEARARAEGSDVRTVLVTDDVASAPAERAEERRGIAGDFCVFKVAGAGAARGEPMDEVERLARKANANCRTMGVAFGGCTLPGSGEPLFSVEPGRMEIGLGIHGEPGVRSGPRVPAAELAKLLVDPLLAAPERPTGPCRRVSVLVNGLGRTKYEELFVLYKDIAKLMEGEGLEVVSPEVGELVTSLDMAGCSVTVLWLDEELEELWLAPADAPGYRRPGPAAAAPGSQTRSRVAEPARTTSTSSVRAEGGQASPGAQGLTGVPESPGRGTADPAAAGVVRDALRSMLKSVEAVEDELGRLDAVAGDGDHGRGMVRGLRSAVAAVGAPGEVPGELLERAGAAWAEAAGGASGALWGAMLQAFGGCLSQEGTGPVAIGAALDAARSALVSLGGSRTGDKTMLDALSPFVDTYSDHVRTGGSLSSAWDAAVVAGQQAADATATLISRRGRSAVLGERSRGTPDPGAISLMHCLRAAGRVLERCADGPNGGAAVHAPGKKER